MRNARGDAFDSREYSARVNLDYSLGRDGVIYLGSEYRIGDNVSTGLVSAASGAIGTVITPDDAYGGALTAYRFDAKTVIWTVGYNLPLGPRDSLDFSWRHIRSTPSKLGPFAGSAFYPPVPGDALTRYTADQFSIAYLMRF